MHTLKLTIALLMTSYFLVGCQEDSKRKPATTPAPAEQQKPNGENVTKNEQGKSINVDGSQNEPVSNKVIGKLMMKVDTRFKTDTTTDYTKEKRAMPDKFCPIAAGASVEVMEVVSEEQKYVKVRLSSNPSTCNFAEGYFFKDHLISATPQ